MAIPVSPTLEAVTEQADNEPAELRTPEDYDPVDDRTILITALAVVVAIGASLAAEVLTHLIGLATNLAFYGRVDFSLVSPAGGHRAPAALLFIPILGAVVIGLMA